ncbi:hypothetical protein ACTI_57090 [Actinoplanes sp. OR16]|nr:hypothetical protein ACTI_57090 [Actinoplanes sp. OR16]
MPSLSRAELSTTIADSLRTELAAGVTTVRDLGDHDYAVVDHRNDAVAGRDNPAVNARSPAIVASGPPITTPDGHCASMGGGVHGVEAVRRAVRERADRGADVVKVMATGGMMTAGTDVRACQFTHDEMRAIVDEAHRLGLPVTAHAHATAGIEQCVDAGVDGIEHAGFFGADGIDTPPALVRRIAAAGIVVCPTVGADVRPGTVLPDRLIKAGFTPEGRRAQVGALYRAGVTLISGVDAGIHPAKPHGYLPRSIAELAACGVPAAALASATSLAAKACGVSSRTGCLKAGLDADLLLVHGDPLHDLTALQNVHTVFRAGHRL